MPKMRATETDVNTVKKSSKSHRHSEASAKHSWLETKAAINSRLDKMSLPSNIAKSEGNTEESPYCVYILSVLARNRELL